MPTQQTILLVEDDPNDVLFLRTAFERTGLDQLLQVARHGRQALDYLRGAGEYADREEYPLPFLTLLDLKLPYVPGLDVLKSLRQDPLTRQIIVIILTSSQEQSDIDRAYALGANAFVAKPPNMETFQKLATAIRDFWIGFALPPRGLQPAPFLSEG
jgi:CheY-like chemotaxis protein